MLKEGEYKEYLEWQSAEAMDSENQSDKIIDSVKHFPDDAQNILCIGVGDGYELKVIQDTGRLVEGITLNLNAVKYERDLADFGDMHNLDFKDGSKDLVYCKDCFEHSFSHWLSLKEMARVSNEYVLIVLPFVEVWSSGKYHTVVLNKTQLVALAEKFDLKLVDSWDYSETTGYLFKKND